MLGVMGDGVGQFIRSHVHFFVVSELRPFLPILCMSLDVDGLQPTKFSSLAFLRERPGQGRHITIRSL